MHSPNLCRPGQVLSPRRGDLKLQVVTLGITQLQPIAGPSHSPQERPMATHKAASPSHSGR